FGVFLMQNKHKPWADVARKNFIIYHMKSMHLHRVYLATEHFLLTSDGTEVGGNASMEKIMEATLEAYMAHTPKAIRELANEVGHDHLSPENYAIFQQGCTDLGSM